MENLFLKYLVAALVTMPLALVLTMWFFDKLLRLEHDQHPGEWQQDGAPNGFFWKPQGHKIIKYHPAERAKRLLAWVWFFHTPQWLQTHREARKFLWQYRFCVIFAALPFASILTLLCYALLRAGNL